MLKADGRMSTCRTLATVLAALTLAAAGWGPAHDVRALERVRVLAAADAFLGDAPVTIVAYRSPRSAGGPHDFFSEADYWWPDPQNPGGPYIQRDGLSNPHNFVEHRRAMIRFSERVATLVSAWRLTGNERYAAAARRHLRAWFVDEATRMAPHLLYAQAIQGRVSGRGVGIIDTVHLVEVARAAALLAGSPSADAGEQRAVTDWFAQYLRWLTTHPYGLAERDARNNHGTCWVMQAAAFAQATGDQAVLALCRDRFKQVLVPEQMAPDGSFPLELKRSKPYGYSIFNLDAMAAICRILSPARTGRVPRGPGRLDALPLPAAPEDLWAWTTADGRGMRRAMAFLYPYLRDKAAWPFAHDVMYFDRWPVRQPSLLFAGLAFGERRYLDLWASLDPAPATEEVIRNLPIRHPLLWVE